MHSNLLYLTSEYRACLESQFRCNSSHCVNKRFVCDGDKDCQDMSDETNCPTRYPGGRHCPANKFQCANTVRSYYCWTTDGDVPITMKYYYRGTMTTATDKLITVIRY